MSLGLLHSAPLVVAGPALPRTVIPQFIRGAHFVPMGAMGSRVPRIAASRPIFELGGGGTEQGTGQGVEANDLSISETAFVATNEGGKANAKRNGGSVERHAHTVDGHLAGVPTVIDLLLACGPLYVAGLIAQRSINAVKAVFLAGPVTHISKEGVERQPPTLANLDAQGPVVSVARVRRIFAPRNHPGPHVIERVLGSVISRQTVHAHSHFCTRYGRAASTYGRA